MNKKITLQPRPWQGGVWRMSWVVSQHREKKLLFSLVVRQRILLYLLPDGSRHLTSPIVSSVFPVVLYATGDVHHAFPIWRLLFLLFFKLDEMLCRGCWRLGVCVCAVNMLSLLTHIAGHPSTVFQNVISSCGCAGRKLLSADKWMECVLQTKHAPLSTLLPGCNHSILSLLIKRLWF